MKKLDAAGLVPLLLVILCVVLAVIYLAYRRVAEMQG